MLKLWYSLNKLKSKGLVITSLLNPTMNEETQNPKNMLKIARDHHSQLQSEPPMNDGQRKGIDKILTGITKKLNDDERKNISKEISFMEVK